VPVSTPSSDPRDQSASRLRWARRTSSRDVTSQSEQVPAHWRPPCRRLSTSVDRPIVTPRGRQIRKAWGNSVPSLHRRSWWMKGRAALAHRLVVCVDPYPTRAVWRESDMSRSDRQRGEGFPCWTADAAAPLVFEPTSLSADVRGSSRAVASPPAGSLLFPPPSSPLRRPHPAPASNHYHAHAEFTA